MRRGFTIHHNGPPADCVDQPHSRCLAFWDAVRRFHVVEKGWSGIAYSWGVCPHGERLEGQGWDRAQFANGSDMVGADDGDDSEWYSVLVFVGGAPSTGDTEPPTPEMIAATAALIGEGRSSGRCGRRVTPHNFWKPKPCPGPEFTDLAELWDDAPLLIPPMYLQEDDMPLDANDKTWIREQLGLTAGALVTGAANSLANPTQSGWGWVGQKPAGLNALRAQIAAKQVDVDVQVLAVDLAVALADKLDGVDHDEVVAAVREVFADAADG